MPILFVARGFSYTLAINTPKISRKQNLLIINRITFKTNEILKKL